MFYSMGNFGLQAQQTHLGLSISGNPEGRVSGLSIAALLGPGDSRTGTGIQ